MRHRMLDVSMLKGSALALLLGAGGAVAAELQLPPDPLQVVGKLDADYQAAVKANDAARMEQILAEDFELVLGDGRVVTREELLKSARERTARYERQDESSKTVRLLGGETAVVTAQLWLKGKRGDEAFDRKLWYSDVYVLRDGQWKYAFGQASLQLPADKGS